MSEEHKPYVPPAICIKALKKYPNKSYVMDCLLRPRDGETLFRETEHGVHITIMGYAIIPIEEYNELTAASKR